MPYCVSVHCALTWPAERVQNVQMHAAACELASRASKCHTGSAVIAPYWEAILSSTQVWRLVAAQGVYQQASRKKHVENCLQYRQLIAVVTKY
jgi:hypothetical protein